jgi:uncharacterized protein YbjT (DUF2867 family)
MKQKPIILITGATGAQGGSVARALLRDHKFTVRILTRNPFSEKAIALRNAGAQVVQGDLDDTFSLLRAMKDCYGVYGVTNFWEHYAKEFSQGENLIHAVQKSGIKHFVMHAMPNYYRISNGNYAVPQYDLKAELQGYAEWLDVPATFVHLSFYYENFLNMFPLQKDENGGYCFGFPQGNTPLAAVSVEDVGGLVKAVFDNPSKYIGRTVTAVGANDSCSDYADVMSEVLGRKISYKYVKRDEYAAYNFPGAEEIASMFEVQRLYIPNKRADLMESYQMNPEMQTFESWLIQNKAKFEAYFNSLDNNTAVAA